MKTENQEQLINDKSHSQADALADLTVAEEQADETKGGAFVSRPIKIYQAPGDPTIP